MEYSGFEISGNDLYSVLGPKKRVSLRLMIFFYSFCFVPGERKPSKFNPLHTDTPLIRTLSMAHSVSVSTGFDRGDIKLYVHGKRQTSDSS